MVQKTLNALYGGLAFLRANKDAAVKLIAEIDEIPAEIAAAELDGNIMKLETDGSMDGPKIGWSGTRARHGAAVGMTDLAPVEEIYLDAVQAGADQGLRRRDAAGMSASDQPDAARHRAGAGSAPLGNPAAQRRRQPAAAAAARDVLAMLGDLLGGPRCTRISRSRRPR